MIPLSLRSPVRRVFVALAVALGIGTTPSSAQSYYDMPDFDVEEVCEIWIEEGRLRTEVKLPADFTARRFSVTGLRGYTTGSYRSSRLRLENSHNVGPGRAPASFSLQRSPFALQINYSVTGPGHFTLQYQQFDNHANGVEDGSVTVRITRGGEGEEASETTVLRARDFRALRREYPRETGEFLGPVFRALRATAAFGVDRRFALQVLKPPTPEAELRGEVARLVGRLDARDRRERERASARIEELGTEAVTLLGEWDTSGLSPQQQADVEAVLANTAAPTPDQRERLRKDPDFLIDCLYCEDREVRDLAVGRLKAVSKVPVKFDAHAPAKEPARAIEALREEIGRQWVVDSRQ